MDYGVAYVAVFSALCPRTHSQFRPANGGVLRDVDDIPFVPDEHETTILGVLNLGSYVSCTAGTCFGSTSERSINSVPQSNKFMSLDCHLLIKLSILKSIFPESGYNRAFNKNSIRTICLKF